MPYTRMPTSSSRLGPVRGALSDRLTHITAMVKWQAEKCKLRKTAKGLRDVNTALQVLGPHAIYDNVQARADDHGMPTLGTRSCAVSRLSPPFQAVLSRSYSST